MWLLFMTWQKKYWDAVDQFYWTPKHLGLNSIPKSEWGDDPENIVIQRSMLAKDASLYTRVGKAKENALRMQGLEETLNHIFEITFGIASDAAISEIIFRAVGLLDEGPFERIGREASIRYRWGNKNVTQQDAFFVSPVSLLGIEMKLGSTTRPEQVVKYLCLVLMEEMLSGRRSSVGLLYITPYQAETVWKQAGATNTGILPLDFITTFDSGKLNSYLQNFYLDNQLALLDLACRFQMTHISWSELIARCSSVAAALDGGHSGDATLARLLNGFIDAIKNHKGTQC